VHSVHAYLTRMTIGTWPIAFAVAAGLLPAGPSHAQFDGDRYNIMKPEPGNPRKSTRSKPTDNPEPWLAPKYKSPRGTKKRITTPKRQPAPKKKSNKVPPSLYVPETGRTLRNLPSPTGTETSQQRALRCAHQAGVYGQAAGNRTNYINSCINQR
jgi:hypothetical protein